MCLSFLGELFLFQVTPIPPIPIININYARFLPNIFFLAFSVFLWAVTYSILNFSTSIVVEN